MNNLYLFVFMQFPCLLEGLGARSDVLTQAKMPKMSSDRQDPMNSSRQILAALENMFPDSLSA